MFISTIRNGTCQMIGYYCRSYKAFQRGECGDCGDDGSRCALLGFRADKYSPFKNSNFSSMYLITGSFPSFCGENKHLKNTFKYFFIVFVLVLNNRCVFGKLYLSLNTEGGKKFLILLRPLWNTGCLPKVRSTSINFKIATVKAINVASR